MAHSHWLHLTSCGFLNSSGGMIEMEWPRTTQASCKIITVRSADYSLEQIVLNDRPDQGNCKEFWPVLRMLGRLPQRNLKRKRTPLFPAFNRTLNGFLLFPQFKTAQLAPLNLLVALEAVHHFQAKDGCEKVSGHDNQIPNPLVLMKIHHWAREYGNDLQQKPLEFSSWNLQVPLPIRNHLYKSLDPPFEMTKLQLLLVKWHWAMKPRKKIVSQLVQCSHRVVSQCRSSKNRTRMVTTRKVPKITKHTRRWRSSL